MGILIRKKSKDQPEISYLAILAFLAFLAFFTILPNIAIILFLLIGIIHGVSSRKLFAFYLTVVLIYLAFVLSTKSLEGDANDYVSYVNNIQAEYLPNFTSNPSDFFFWFFANKIYSIVGIDNKNIFFFTVQIVSVIPLLFVFIDKQRYGSVRYISENTAFFIFIFISSIGFWNLYGNYLRQAWVFSFSLMALSKLSRDDAKIQSLVWALLAAASHSSGILILCFVLFGWRFSDEFKEKLIGLTLIVSLICFVIKPLSLITNIMPGIIASKLNFYAAWNGEGFGDTASIRILIITTITYLMLNFYKKRNLLANSFLLNVFLYLSVNIFFSSIVSDVPKIVERLYYPITILFMIVFSDFFCMIKKHTYKNNPFLIFISLFFVLCFFFYSLNSSLFYNKNFFSGDLEKFMFYSFV